MIADDRISHIADRDQSCYGIADADTYADAEAEAEANTDANADDRR